jgi:hypothetical protein
MRPLLLSIVPIFLAAACGSNAESAEQSGSGERGERSYEVAGFDQVTLAGPYDVVIVTGQQASVRASGDAEALERMVVEVKDGELRIRPEKKNWNFGSSRRGQVTVEVTVPSLRAATIGGSGDMKIGRVEGSEFAASIGGSGDMEIERLEVRRADFSIAGSGGIRAAGAVESAEISIAGSGDIDLQGLEARTADISVVGSGDVRSRATETAKVSIMGSGDVSVAGGARCSVSKMGSGDVRCG